MELADRTGKAVSPETAIFILLNVIPYLPLVCTILGLLGFLGNALTILQPELRGNTCCIYTLSSSVVDVLHLLINVFPEYLKTNNSYQLPWNWTTSLCKLYYFLYSFLPQLAINLLVLTIFDRFACTRPLGSPLHRFNQTKVAFPMIVGTIVISCLLSLYGPILAYIGPFGCSYRQLQVYGVLNICINGIMQPSVMLVFALLTYRNVRLSRRRVVSVSEEGERDEERSF